MMIRVNDFVFFETKADMLPYVEKDKDNPVLVNLTIHPLDDIDDESCPHMCDPFPMPTKFPVAYRIFWKYYQRLDDRGQLRSNGYVEQQNEVDFNLAKMAAEQELSETISEAESKRATLATIGEN